MPEQAAARKNAALAGFHPVEQDLAAAGGGLGHAHAAFDQERKAAAGLSGVEKNAACARAMPLRLVDESVEPRVRQFGEHGETLQQLPATRVFIVGCNNCHILNLSTEQPMQTSYGTKVTDRRYAAG